MVEIIFVRLFRGVGAIIVSKATGNVLTVLRSPRESYPNTWSFAGGKVEQDESELHALERELIEELALMSFSKIIPLHRYQSKARDFIYDTFVVLVEDEFIPTLNWENSGYAWTKINSLPQPLHPKTRQMLSSSRLVSKFKNFYTWVDNKDDSEHNTIPKK